MASLARNNWFSTAAKCCGQACVSWPIKADWAFRRGDLKETGAYCFTALWFQFSRILQLRWRYVQKKFLKSWLDAYTWQTQCGSYMFTSFQLAKGQPFREPNRSGVNVFKEIYSHVSLLNEIIDIRHWFIDHISHDVSVLLCRYFIPPFSPRGKRPDRKFPAVVLSYPPLKVLLPP